MGFECLQGEDFSYCCTGIGSLGMVMCVSMLLGKTASYSRHSPVMSLFLCMLSIIIPG